MNIHQDWWLVECCLICGSANHIHITDPEADAWECYNCLNRWWLDDIARTIYMIRAGFNEDEAENNLGNADDTIIFLFGQFERNLE